MKNLSESQFFASFDANSSKGQILTLDAEESNHAVKVFRHRIGDYLRIGNGCGLQGTGVLTVVSPQSAQLQLDSLAPLQASPRLHLAIACLKDNDLEDVIDSCGQLNLASLTLLRTDHSQEPRNSDLGRTVRRLEMKSMVAYKQSLKPWLTTIKGPLQFSDWLANCKAQIVLCDIDGNAKLSENILAASGGECVLAIGPEGGFSKPEMDAMKARNALILALGSTRLRAKTCPAIAMGALLGMGFAG